MIQQKKDALGVPGAKSWRKILNSLRRFFFGLPYEAVDDQSRMPNKSKRKAFNAFLRAMQDCYASKLLNIEPPCSELQEIEAEYASDRFQVALAHKIVCMFNGKLVLRFIRASTTTPHIRRKLQL